MSQKVSPQLFNNYVYNNSKWFNKLSTNKFLLNEDLQIRELINIVFKNSLNSQFLFVDKIVIYKYASKIKIYIYYFCNFFNLKKNIIMSQSYTNKKYINIYYLYYKYLENINIKKIEILKILSVLKYKSDNIYLYFKNLNYNLNNKFNFMSKIYLNKNKKNLINYSSYKTKLYFNINNNNKFLIKNKYKKTNNLAIIKQRRFLSKRYATLKCYKSIYFILYLLCYNDKFINKVTITSLINIIFFELNSIDNAMKNYNFIFYNIFNLIRDCLTLYFKDENCKIKGIRIQVKGRYMLTKRKRIFIFNFGNLNLNKISLNKDYSYLNLVKSTGTSSIKIWVTYKN